MSKFETISVVLAALSFVGSFAAMFIAGQANNTNKRMFRRQGVIDLHMAWVDIKAIDPQNLITTDIVRAVNALSLTASLWNHDVIEKPILYQTYWNSYRELYDTLYSITDLVPGQGKTCKSLMTSEITNAYIGMKTADLDIVLSSNL